MIPIPVFLNLGESRTFPREHTDWCRAAVSHYLEAFGPVNVVTVRPDAWPGSYVEVRYGPTLGHMRRRMGVKIASLCTTRLFDGGFFGEWYPHVIWHDEEFVKAPAGHPQPLHALIEAITLATVHEFAHALGWTVGPNGEHDSPPENSYEWWLLTKRNFSTAAANLAVYAREKTDA